MTFDRIIIGDGLCMYLICTHIQRKSDENMKQVKGDGRSKNESIGTKTDFDDEFDPLI